LETFLAEIGRRVIGEFYVSGGFWACFALIALLYRLLPLTGAPKALLLAACNISMLMTLPRFTAASLAILLILCILSFLAGNCLNRASSASVVLRRFVAAMGILTVLSMLAFFKYDFVQQAILGRKTNYSAGAADLIYLIGISYVSFKAMHFIIEGYTKELKQVDLVGFINYMVFFPSFVSGPINRYNHYHSNSSEMRKSAWREDISAGMERIIHGLFKKTVVTAVLLPYTLTNMAINIDQMTPLLLIVGLYVYAFYFYYDFSGYTDLAIGAGRIMGFALPENFNAPFLKRNIQQLWANWHMSLTSWLTDYIYWPIVRRMREILFFRKHPILLSNFAILVTFLACGIWHGNTMNFLLWGLYHGVGISLVNTYQNWKRKVRNEHLRDYFTSRVSYWVGVFMTFNYFAGGLLLFVLNMRQIATLIRL
jgi:alginate O-acetyltransferase complex protein AlgI